ncbi:CAAX prenyl protease 2 isoform X2 [Vidua chalybeata]|uniref:CAAX prenyl protease 2 isoform X2 n=1 Tax=Vidua chalybeata TaxID=81927 RepID=UPI0023A81B73|nr:CAAX prenyl protease 2 isoform X2 [Vidua chalybeata]
MAEGAVRAVLEQLLVALGTPKNGEPRRGALLVALTAGGALGGGLCTLTVAATGPLSRDLDPETLGGGDPGPGSGAKELPDLSPPPAEPHPGVPVAIPAPDQPRAPRGRVPFLCQHRWERHVPKAEPGAPLGTGGNQTEGAEPALHWAALQPPPPEPGAAAAAAGAAPAGGRGLRGGPGAAPGQRPRPPRDPPRARTPPLPSATLPVRPRGGPRAPPGPPNPAGPLSARGLGGLWPGCDPPEPQKPPDPRGCCEDEEEPVPPDVTFGVRWDPPEGDGDPQTSPKGDPKTLLVFLFLRHRDPFGGYDAGTRRLLLAQLEPTLRLGRPALARGLRALLHPLLGGLRRQHQAPPKSSAGGGGRRRRRRKGPGATSARDHPAVIKRRFTSVLVVSGLSPALVWLWKELTGVKADTPLPALLGLRLEGLLPATLLPLLLTMILFLGPLIQLSMDCPWRWLDGIRVALDPRVWALCLGDVRWLRNQVVAPLTEELVFRACMLPMLVPCTGPGPAVLACPLFFGVAHFHHVIEQLRFRHGSVGSIFMAAAFQFSYTAVFGAYTAFLFLRTGHLAGPVLCHSFCNSMGFPALGAALGHPRRRALLPAYLLGVLGFLLLLHPLTEPAFFGARPPCRDPPACS